MRPPGIQRSGRVSTEWLIVLLAVGSAVLSAVAFWESTRYGDTSADMANQARFVEAQESQWRSGVQAKIAHERRVAVRCETAIAQRTAALLRYSQSFDSSAIAVLVEAEQDRIALEAQFVANSSCAGYDVGRVFEWEALNRLNRVASDSGAALDAGSEGNGRAEQLAVLAAVTFAIALLLLTAADSTSRRRWVRGWLVAALGCLAVGGLFVVISIRQSGDDPVPAALLIVGAAVLPFVLAVSLLRPGGRRWTRSISRGRSVRWWAEVLGAIALVLLTVGALGLALSSSRERAAVADADALTSESRRALEIGQQSALALLGVVQQVSEIDADQAGALQSPAGGGSGAPGQTAEQPVRDALLGDIWGREQAAWEQLLAEQAPGDRSGAPAVTTALGCLQSDLVLAWSTVGLGTTGKERGFTPPAALLGRYREDPSVYGTFIEQSATGAVVCAAQAAVRMQQAQDWGDRASAFTLAIVVLGLAGFLFALAADPDRSRAPRQWLLGCAALGLMGGVVLTSAAWASGPRDLPDDAIGRGTVAFARSQMALVAGDCVAAVGQADEAVRELGRFAPAHLARAYALLCDDEVDGLIAPTIPRATLEEYRSRLEDAIVSLGVGDSSTLGSLGWAHLLRGLDPTLDRDVRDDAVQEARALTHDALRADPGNPFWCFNRALGALAAGEAEGARRAYEEALASLAGEPVATEGAADPGVGPGVGSTGECAPVAFEDPQLRQWIRLMALADLEIFPDAAELDDIRELIVAGRATDADPGAAIDGLSLEVYPQQVWLVNSDGSSLADREIAIVWYHRSDANQPWAVMVDPSLQTLEPGHHASLVAAYRLLPAGEYRADVYAEGKLAGRAETVSDFWASRGLEAADFQRVEIHDLGVSAVVPIGWDVVAEQPGVEVVLGADDGQVAIRRADGARRDEMEAGLASWSEAWLERWGVPGIDDDEAGLVPAGWYLGFDDTLTAEVRPGLLRGAGNRQYLVAGDDSPLWPEAVAGATCPGTTLMTAIEADDRNVADVVWLSQNLDGLLHSVTPEEIALTGSVMSPAFSVGIPPGWTAAGCPGSSIAADPTGQANVYVGSGPITGGLAAHVDEWIATFEADYQGFELLRREAGSLANGLPSEEIAFTWTPEDMTFLRTQAYVRSGDTAYTLSFTSLSSAADAFAGVLDDTFRSFLVLPPDGSRVAAACEGCSSPERLQRQARIDGLAELLAIVDEGCRDTTDGAPAGTLARIGCSLPGGFDVDVALWESREALDAVGASHQARPGARLLDWRLYPSQDARTGLTLEWVDSGAARFFWTYEERLVSADASLAGGDQQRLNSWWQTSGALVRE